MRGLLADTAAAAGSFLLGKRCILGASMRRGWGTVASLSALGSEGFSGHVPVTHIPAASHQCPHKGSNR